MTESEMTMIALDEIQRKISPPRHWEFYANGSYIQITRYKRNPNPTGKLSDIFELYVDHEDQDRRYTGLELLEELADRFPMVAKKLAEPMRIS